MPDPAEVVETAKPKDVPLVFISHDSRDAELADAFSKLLKSVSAGMLKSFRSSDKKGTEGIQFGDEWYKTLMGKLDRASDVVCLFTERSIDRPWILYEAGVAKGKLGAQVQGVALGVSLSRVSVGPFYQFQNSDDSEDSLTKLVLQLCRRVPNLEPDESVVTGQVRMFKEYVGKVLKEIGDQKKTEKIETKSEAAINEAAVAKVLEEMKLVVREVSMRSERLMLEGAERLRPRRISQRRIRPGMIDEMAHMISRRISDPIGILVLASLVRDDFPWLYELGLEAYHVAKKGNAEHTRAALEAFRDAAEFTLRGPLAAETEMTAMEMEGMRELPELIHRYIRRAEETSLPKRAVPAAVRAKKDI